MRMVKNPLNACFLAILFLNAKCNWSTAGAMLNRYKKIKTALL